VPGLATTYRAQPDVSWGSTNYLSVVLTHVADASATNYEYTIWLGGNTPRSAMVMVSNNLPAKSPLYTLDFDVRSPLRPNFVDQPQFDGQPMPSAYQG